MIDWETVLVTSVIAIGLGFFFKYGVKPKIEKVYESNRDYAIDGMVRDIYTTDRFTNIVIELLKKKDGFVPNENRRFNFSQQERNKIQNCFRQTQRILEAFKNYRDFKIHLTYDEYHVLTN